MDLKQIKQLDQQYYMPVFGERLPVCFTHGEGATLFDTDGKKYTDFLAGIAVNALGYSDEGFIKTVQAQAAQLIHTSNYFYNEPQALLAEALCKKSGMDRVFFANSGAEANECAIKLAKMRAYKKGMKTANFVALKNSFHGRTLATLSATGQDKFHQPFEPCTYNWTYVAANDQSGMKDAINADTCAVMIELIQGEGGVHPLDAEFIDLIEDLCNKNDALLIVDEIQTGMGRTGKFLGCQQAEGVHADIITMAKALGGGIPIGACLAKEKVASAFSPGDHGSTFGGGQLACAAALYTVKRIDDKMLYHITDLGNYFKTVLVALKDRLPHAVADVRGLGLMLGLELTESFSATKIRSTLLEEGFIVGTAGANTLRFVPPYIITKPDIDELVFALVKLLQ
ncbi:aspartate aminotransferase family protein [Christensenellaceae bacterium OttesenSCG-928-K19]|nr:aspartate aminotransferase family protein [Christensenellaceae bacterium OttesenSCG-928-K19]